MTGKQSAVDSNENEKNEQTAAAKRWRWAAEFFVRPYPGCLEKTECISKWFTNKDDARDDAFCNSDKEVSEYPSAGRIMKLSVEDDSGTVVVLKNATTEMVER